MNYNLSTNPFDPASLMFIGVGGSTMRNDRNELFRMLTNKHMVETLERFTWDGLPEELPQDLIERIIYFRGKGAFFKYADKFWFLPFALKGTIDSYGRYESISPVLFTGQFNTTTKKWKDSAFLPDAVTDTGFSVMYNILREGVEVAEDFAPAIILTDQSYGISQEIIPHSQRVLVLMERLVNTLIMVEMNNINGIQTYALFVKDEAQKEAVENEFNEYDKKILQGKRVTVIVGDTTVKPFEELTTAKGISDSQRYWQSYQAWDNLRKEIIGISNGGQHLKMEHATTAETEMSSSSASSVMLNALRMREDFCELINFYYGLNVSVNSQEIEEQAIMEEQGVQSDEIDEESGGSEDV